MKNLKNIFNAIFSFIFIMSSLVFSYNVKAAGNYSAGSLLALEGQGGAAVYYIGSDGKKYVFPDQKTYDTWYDNFDNVTKVSVAELDLYPDGGAMTYRPGTDLVTHENTAKIYAVSPGGVLHWIPTAEVAENLYGTNWGARVMDVIPGYFSSSYTTGSDLSDVYPDGSLVETNSQIYYIDDGTKRLFKDNGFFDNNFKQKYVIDANNLDNYPEGSDINSQESDLSSLVTTPEDENSDNSNNGDETGDNSGDNSGGEATTTPAHDQKIILLGHTIGSDLFNDGHVADWFTNYNTTNNTEYDISFRDYPDYPYSTNSFPYDYWYIWKEGNCDMDDAGRECISKLASEYDVISYQHSYEASDVLGNIGINAAGYDRKSIEAYQGNYRDLLTVFDEYPDTMFIVWTLPPRHSLHGHSTTTSYATQAARATQFSDWLRDEWLAEDGQPHPNVFVFDFRSHVIGPDNYLKYDYRRVYTYADPHLNDLGNQEMGELFSQTVVDDINSFLGN